MTAFWFEGEFGDQLGELGEYTGLVGDNPEPGEALFAEKLGELGL